MSYGTVNSPDTEESAGLLGGDAEFGTPSKEATMNRSNRQKSVNLRLILAVLLVFAGTCGALWLTSKPHPAPEQDATLDWIEPTPGGHKIPIPSMIQSAAVASFPTALPTQSPTVVASATTTATDAGTSTATGTESPGEVSADIAKELKDKIQKAYLDIVKEYQDQNKTIPNFVPEFETHLENTVDSASTEANKAALEAHV